MSSQVGCVNKYVHRWSVQRWEVGFSGSSPFTVQIIKFVGVAALYIYIKYGYILHIIFNYRPMHILYISYGRPISCGMPLYAGFCLNLQIGQDEYTTRSSKPGLFHINSHVTVPSLYFALFFCFSAFCGLWQHLLVYLVGLLSCTSLLIVYTILAYSLLVAYTRPAQLGG